MYSLRQPAECYNIYTAALGGKVQRSLDVLLFETGSSVKSVMMCKWSVSMSCPGKHCFPIQDVRHLAV